MLNARWMRLLLILLWPLVPQAQPTSEPDRTAKAQPTTEPGHENVALPRDPDQTAEASPTPEPDQAKLAETVTVTATRTETRLAETAASVVVLGAREILRQAAGSTDDLLRQVPGFSLFRRSGSRAANPTTQGATLRGLGGSGASRALVLLDGLPLNDPFGGWVLWGRVPRVALERIEVLRGGGSDLYGSSALAGVVQMVPHSTESGQVLLETSYGQQGSADVALYGGGLRGRWGASLWGQSFQTEGYRLLRDEDAGAVDVQADVRFSSFSLTLERALGVRDRLFLRGSLFDEARQNGTQLQSNATQLAEVSAGFDGARDWGAWILRAYHLDQEYRQIFTAVDADRATERLTRSQTVPARASGFSGQVSGVLGAQHTLVGGLDLREVRGTSEEDVPLATGTGFQTSGGRQITGGLFIEDLWRASPKLTVTAGLRLDLWQNRDGKRTNRQPGGTTTTTALEDADATAWSPRLSVLWRVSDRLSWHAAGYRAFRAPTLNELYRAFRVGDVQTLANEALEDERLTGVEAGGRWNKAGKLALRATAFWMEVDRTIANVTLETTPTLITRQRQNLGRSRSRGLELDAQAQLGPHLKATAGWLLADTSVLEFSADPRLEGRRLPQVPRHQLTAQLTFEDPSLLTASLQARWSDRQFDDDRNQFELDSAFTLDAFAARPFTRSLEAFLAAENLLDQRLEAGRSGILTLGPPRQVRLGLRLRIGPQL